MTMGLALLGSGPPNPIIKSVFTNGKMNLRPAGVQITEYITQSQAGSILALDIENTYFAGLDVGAFATIN